MTSASFAISTGWNVSGPSGIHRFAPLRAGMPSATASKSDRDQQQRIGPRAQPAIVDARAEPQREPADRDEQELALEEVRRVAELGERLGGGRGVDLDVPMPSSASTVAISTRS